MSANGQTPRGKRSRKRNQKNRHFLSNAKGFAKRGIYGRGTEIDEEIFSYYLHLLDAMKQGFEDAEEKVSMANNAFERTDEQEIHLASNQVVCKALETLIGFVDAQHLERFFNVFAENLRPICSNRFASHVLQKMVEIAFLRSVNKDENITNDKKLFTNVIPIKRAKIDSPDEESFNLDTEFTAAHKENCLKFVERVSKFLLNNLEDFVWDVCANHIMRTCIYSLAGLHVLKVAFEKSTTGLPKHWNLYKVPANWWEILKEFPQRLEMWPHFTDFPYQDHSSALLSVICIALKIVDKNLLKHFGKRLLMEAFLKVDENEHFNEDNKTIEVPDDNEDDKTQNDVDNDEIIDDRTKEKRLKTNDEINLENKQENILPRLPKVFQHQTSVVLLETLLSISGPKLFTQCYAMLFVGRLSKLAVGAQTNFSVQKILQNVKEKDDFENIFNELVDEIETLLKMGYTGVVEALVSACLRLTTKQAKIIVALQTALHVADDKEKTAKHFIECLCKLKPYEIARDDTTAFVHLHGSLIVQHILKFNKPILLVNCILETPTNKLAGILNTPNGSHIADAFLMSKFIGEKSREKFIRQLEGYYVDLAITRHGSRVVEQCFAVAQETQKQRIVKELAAKCNQLKSTPFGHHINRNLRVETYRLTPTQWKASMEQQKDKANEIFKDIVT